MLKIQEMDALDDIVITEVKGSTVKYELTRDRKMKTVPLRLYDHIIGWEDHGSWLLQQLTKGKRYWIDQCRDGRGRIWWVGVTPIAGNKPQYSKTKTYWERFDDEPDLTHNGLLTF